MAQDEPVDSVWSAIKQGSIKLDLRHRLERVEQDGFDENARASLLRSRLSLESGSLHGFSGFVEIDDVTSIGADEYNSTENGNIDYPTIADPEGTDLNQALLAFAHEGFDARGGRQRITLNNRRFVGSKPWRNNEQTYDGLRVRWSPNEVFTLDASYVNRVNRIYGPDDDGSNPADWKGDSVFVLVQYTLVEGHTLSGFGIGLDVENQSGFTDGQTINNSSDTLGVEYRGGMGELSLQASYARQSDAGSSELDYDADYYVIEIGARALGLSFKAAQEVLGADNGVGFATPLANGHGFQGWADKFLGTPGDGIEDTWLSIGGAVGPVQMLARYHDFRAEASSVKYGTEVDLQADWKATERFSTTLKAGLFATDDPQRYDDTDKVWLILQYKL
ncbi:MAG: alginate export family protein [Pseudomonadota bacterium]